MPSEEVPSIEACKLLLGQYEQKRAGLQERIEMLKANAMNSDGNEISTGTATAIEITKQQIAELDEAIARCRRKLDAQR